MRNRVSGTAGQGTREPLAPCLLGDDEGILAKQRADPGNGSRRGGHGAALRVCLARLASLWITVARSLHEQLLILLSPWLFPGAGIDY